MSYPDQIGTEPALSETAPIDLVSAIDPVPVLSIPSPNFCGRCGCAWDPRWLECQPCATKKLEPLQTLNVSAESRAIKSSMWLYMTLLAICMIGLAFGGKRNALEIEFIELIGIAGAVLLWSLGSFRNLIRPLSTLPRVGWFALALGLSLVTYFIGASVIQGFNRTMNFPNVSMSGPFIKAGYSWGFVVLCICVQPALFEELAFRGVIFSGLSKTLSNFETVMVTALMFMILHLSPARFPHTFALGITAGYLRLRTKSLYPCILLHFSHNFICVLMEWVAR